MTRAAKIYARLQSQKSGSVRHIKYLLDGHGTDSTTVELWTKGIPKKLANIQDLPTVWSKIDRRWKQEKNSGGTVAKQSKVTYMQALIALPNNITDTERHSLVKQLLRLFPQQHPVTIVAHDYGTSGLSNKHLHVAFSYRKHGYGKVNREFQRTFEKDLKKLLKQQYKKYGFKIEENKKSMQIKRKPQTLMRVLLKQHGRERMRNPSYLSSVILPQLKAEVVKCHHKYAEEQSDINAAYLNAATSTVAWLTLEISKAQHLKQPSRVPKRRQQDTESPFGSLYRSSVKIAPQRKL